MDRDLELYKNKERKKKKREREKKNFKINKHTLWTALLWTVSS